MSCAAGFYVLSMFPCSVPRNRGSTSKLFVKKANFFGFRNLPSQRLPLLSDKCYDITL